MDTFTYRIEEWRGQLREAFPPLCPNGHELGPGRMIVGYNTAPDGERRRSWECRVCGMKTWGIEAG